MFPIRKDRHSGFLIPQVEVGFSGNRGRFVKNFGYYWAPSDYWDLTGWVDYYEQTKWIAHLEGRYKVRYSLSGSVKASFMEELLYSKRRWDLKVDHRQEFGRAWTAGIAADFRSDEAYASDSNQSIQESVNRSLHSQFWLRGRWSGFTVGVTLDRREQLDEGTITELLPKVEVSASQRPLVEEEDDATGLRSWLSNVSYSWNARAVNDRDRSSSEIDAHQGVGARGTVRLSEKLLGWLNLSPRVNLQQNWYDRDKDDREFVSRFTYDASVSTGTTVYGTFYPQLFGLEGARHIVEPQLSYNWTPKFGSYFDEDDADRFYSFAGFGSTPRERQAVSVSLVNKLQLKLRQDTSVVKKDDFLRFSMSASHDFTKDEERWSDVTSRLDLKPFGNSSVRINTRHDAYDWDLERTDLTLSLNLKGRPPLVSETSWEDRIVEGTDSPADQLRAELAEHSVADRVAGRPWSASGTFRYSRGSDPGNATYWLDGRLAFSLTKNWRANYSIHYDLSEQEIASQEYAIHRDMHCWEARFVGRYYNDEWQYYFRISVKALPEIQLESGVKSLNRTVR
ncbi:LPS assembly protein LptD [bacterium]|nr:LPS assembly protein LptD [bacterium]